MGPKQVVQLRVRLELGAMAIMKGLYLLQISGRVTSPLDAVYYYNQDTVLKEGKRILLLCSWR